MQHETKLMSRREALIHATGLAAGAVLAACEPPRSASSVSGGGESLPPSSGTPSSAAQGSGERQSAKKSVRMPTVFLPHGGGPWPFMDDRVFGAPGMWNAMRSYMESLRMVPPETPRAVLMISAHWEAPVPTLMTSSAPPMLYDYYGFPPETYEVQWPAPGAPEVAGRVRELLESAGFTTDADAARGFDHGTFVPLALTYPDADMPTLQLSLINDLDPRRHLELGRALEPLRDEGIFIVGSGMSYHNLRAFFGRDRNANIAADSRAFDEWLAETTDLGPSQRETRLVEWERAPAARASHPREEHLLPLMVVAGAAGNDAGNMPYRDVVMGAHVSAMHFG